VKREKTMVNCHTRGQARIRWTQREDGLRESVQFQPGYNCPVAGGNGHGVHGMEITWLLRGPAGAVQLVFGTDWTPGELYPGHGISPDGTRGWKRASTGLWSTDPSGRGIGVHALVPQYQDHESAECGLLGGAPCFYDEGSSAADPLVPRFLAEGESVIWAELEERYRWASELLHESLA
jgi:hypothetical protein